MNSDNTLKPILSRKIPLSSSGSTLASCFISLLALLSICFSPLCTAAIYKCTDSENHVSFGSTPCANQLVESLEPITTQDPRLQHIDYERWLGASRGNGEDAYWIARWAFETQGEHQLANAMAKLAHQRGQADAAQLLKRLSGTKTGALANATEFQTQMDEYVSGMSQLRANPDARGRDNKRHKDMDKIALALADHVATSGINTLGLSLVAAGGFEHSCEGRSDCVTMPALAGKVSRFGFAPDSRVDSCAPKAARPCLKLEHFMPAGRDIPTDQTSRGEEDGYHIMRVGTDHLWVITTRSETVEVMAVGIQLH